MIDAEASALEEVKICLSLAFRKWNAERFFGEDFFCVSIRDIHHKRDPVGKQTVEHHHHEVSDGETEREGEKPRGSLRAQEFIDDQARDEDIDERRDARDDGDRHESPRISWLLSAEETHDF